MITACLVDPEASGICLYVAASATYQPIVSFLRDVVHSGRWIGDLTSASVRTSCAFLSKDRSSGYIIL